MSGNFKKIRFIDSYVNNSNNDTVEKKVIKNIDTVFSYNSNQINAYIDTSLNTFKNEIAGPLNNIMCDSVQYKYNIGNNIILPYNSIPNSNNDKHKCLNYIGGMLEIGSVQTIDPSKSIINNQPFVTNCFNYTSGINNIGFELSNDAVLLIEIEYGLVPSSNQALQCAIGFELQGFKNDWVTVHTSKLFSKSSLRFSLENALAPASVLISYNFSKNSDYSLYRIRLIASTPNTSNYIVAGSPRLKIVRIM